MGYLQDYERNLRDILKAGDTEKIVTFAKKAQLESYRNGIKEGRSGEDKQSSAQSK